jgi:hypothetical protein
MGGASSAARCSTCEGTRAMVNSFWNDVKKWASQPYNPNMNVLDWGLFLGFVLCVVFLWSRVIRTILEA